VATIPVDRLGSDFQRGEVRFEGLTLPRRSFNLRVFLDEPDANAQTPTEGNPHYLGTQAFFGVGTDPSEAAPGGYNRQLEPTQIKLNVTEKLRDFLRNADKKHVPVTLVAVDRDGNEIPDPGLSFEGLTLVTS
ncbi:MAG: tyrosinase, partial [Candidatus Eremiobacteraeota bacterium]|nr:tyrosinase [Candidatus Eremiobacteraeota bacterium]